MTDPVIQRKIESLIHCLKRLEHKRPKNSNELIDNWDLQDIISINLERAIQLSVDISTIIISRKGLKSGNTMAESFHNLEIAGIISHELSIKMQKSVGFRNISVHEYSSIDWQLVFDIIHNHLGNFKEFLKEIETVL